jgi:hypothetical protein
MVHAEHTVVHVWHDQVVPKMTVLHGQFVQAAPVAAGFDKREPHPRLPLQRRDAVHRAGRDVAGQRHAAEHVPTPCRRFIGGSYRNAGTFAM